MGFSIFWRFFGRFRISPGNERVNGFNLIYFCQHPATISLVARVLDHQLTKKEVPQPGPRVPVIQFTLIKKKIKTKQSILPVP